MPPLQEYHKPETIEEVLALLRRKQPLTVPLAGGTWLNPRLGREVPAGAVVDLGALELDQIERDPDTVRLGPMATLAALAESDIGRSLADGILAQAARQDAPVNRRNAATLGGTVVVAPPDSELILALLALNAELTVQSERILTWRLDRFLLDRPAALQGGLVTQIRLHLPLHAAGAIARLARTPRDHPIVAAVAVITEDGDAMRVALSGVAPRPLLVSFTNASQAQGEIAQALQTAEPYADFRGSADYRREMGALLAKRAFDQVLARCRGC